MPTSQITEQITFIYTPDLQPCARFYEDAVGLELVIDQGSCRIYRVAGDAYLGVCEREASDLDGQRHRSVIVTFVTQDVDGWFERLVHYGATPDQSPRTNKTYGIYHAFVRDPSGYRLELQRFLDTSWSDRQE